MKKGTKKLSEIHKAAKNIRRHSEKQIAEYVRSVEMFGQIRPIVVDEDGTILAGNGLYEALLRAGYDTADVYIMEGLTEAEKKKLMLADNRIFNLGTDALDVFEEFIGELNGDFDIPGYDASLLKAMTFTEDDVDDLQSGYGRISEADKQAMHRNEERLQKDEDEATEDAEQIVAHTEPAHEPAQLLERRYLVCPKCGEKIWL